MPRTTAPWTPSAASLLAGAGRVAGAGAAAALAGLAARYAAGRARADRDWPRVVEPLLADLGEVDDVAVLPLVERLTPSEQVRGEAGVAYRIRAGGTTLLFDTGLNAGRHPRSALADNAEQMGISLDALDAVVISHLHIDHVGGLRAVRRRSFAFSGEEPLEPVGIPAYVPVPMSHPRADVLPTTRPRVVAPGVAVLPPQPRMLFWLGYVSEQALVVNVRDFGLVLVTGCGHPRIEQILGVAERVLDVPVRAVVGGLHLPVHALGTPLVPQAVLGNPHPPWHPISEGDVRHVLAELEARGPSLVALSAHDSTPWTCDAFAEALGDRYRTLRVGEELRITSRGVSLPPRPREPGRRLGQVVRSV